MDRVRTLIIVVVCALFLTTVNRDRTVPSVAAQFLGSFGATRAPAIDVDQNDKLYLMMSVATSPTGGPHSQIFFASSSDGGVNWDNLPKTLNLSDSPGEAFGPSLAVTKIGKIRVYVTYHDNSTGTTQVYLVRSKKRTNFKPSVNITPGAGGAFSPRVAVDSTGAVNVAWGDTGAGGRRVIFRRSTDLGVTFGSPVDVSRSTGLAFEPEIAVDSSDGLNVAWEDTAPGKSVIMYSRSTDGGQSFSLPIQVSKGSGDATEAHIAANSSALSVVWVDASAADHQVRYARSTDQGRTFSDAISISDTPGGDAHKPVLAVFGNIVYVAYHDEAEESHQVYLARSDNAGQRFSRPVQVSDAARRKGRAHSPAMVVDSDGRLHIVWIDSSILGNDEGILLYSNSMDGRTFSPRHIILAAL